VKALALGGAAALLFGFRAFQRASGLPEASAALFCWAPYGFALSWCLPKVEAAGYGLAFAGLAWAWQGRRRAVAAALLGTFLVHTGAALFLGLIGGVLALVRRDARLLAALAAGCLLATPLFAAHLAAGCSAAEALLFSEGDYLRRAGGWSSLSLGWRLPVLAGPIAIACAAAGATALWRTHGLTILAFPVAAAGGVFLARQSPRVAAGAIAACALLALASSVLALPGSCHRRPVELDRVAALELDRCSFRWSFPRSR
jgi:hypothetical protein